MKGIQGPSVVQTILWSLFFNWGSGVVADEGLRRFMVAIGEAAARVGNHYGAGDKFYFIEEEKEKMPTPDEPRSTSIQPTPPVVFPPRAPDHFHLDLTHHFASDSAHFQGQTPPEFKANMARLRRHLETSHQPLVVHVQSFGIQAVGPNGQLTGTRTEAGNYSAVGGQASTEKARFVRMDVQGQGDHVDMNIESGCDQVVSQWSSAHLDATGQGVLTAFKAQHPGVTDNDVLSAARAFSGVIVAKNELGAPANQQMVLELPGGQRVNLGDPNARIPLGTRGPSGWTPLRDGNGQPVTISVREIETMVTHNSVTAPPSGAPTTTSSSSSGNSGTIPLDSMSSTLESSPTSLSASSKTGSSPSTPTSFPLAGDIPDSGAADPKVDNLVASVTDNTGATAVHTSMTNSDQTLQGVQERIDDLQLPATPEASAAAARMKTAFDAYMSAKGSNAARDFQRLLNEQVIAPLRNSNRPENAPLLRFAQALLAQVQMNARLHEANRQTGGGAGAPSILPSTGSATSSPSVMQANPQTLPGAQTIVSGMLSSYTGLRANNPSGARSTLQANLASARGQQATATLGTEVTRQLAAGASLQSIQDTLSQQLGAPVTVTRDGSTVTVKMPTPGGEALPILSVAAPVPSTPAPSTATTSTTAAPGPTATATTTSTTATPGPAAPTSTAPTARPAPVTQAAVNTTMQTFNSLTNAATGTGGTRSPNIANRAQASLVLRAVVSGLATMGLISGPRQAQMEQLIHTATSPTASDAQREAAASQLTTMITAATHSASTPPQLVTATGGNATGAAQKLGQAIDGVVAATRPAASGPSSGGTLLATPAITGQVARLNTVHRQT